ncbi:MAG TPA: hypothetical protein VKG02_15600 [Blastocatellia bacterium]|nr:hypothetical protein [Blastocatellia bacterium]
MGKEAWFERSLWPIEVGMAAAGFVLKIERPETLRRDDEYR